MEVLEPLVGRESQVPPTQSMVSLQMGKVVLREGQVAAQSHRKGQEPWRKQEDLTA